MVEAINNLDNIISELKALSSGSVNNIPPPDDELLNEYEEEIGFKFSNDYRKTLKLLSNVFYGTIDLLSVTKEKKYPSELANTLLEAREQGIPSDWLPICEDNGDYYCLLPDGSIRFWTSNGYSDDKWDNLATWIKDVWIDGN